VCEEGLVEQLPLEISPMELKRMLEAREPVALVDVREAHEYAECRIDGAELVPLGTISKALSSLKEKAAGRRLILYCHHGVRSMRAVMWLRQRGIQNCQSMSGGIDRWAATCGAGQGPAPGVCTFSPSFVFSVGDRSSSSCVGRFNFILTYRHL